MARDPVCGMEVDPHSAGYASEYGGETYHFCSDSCMNKFNQDPAGFTEERHVGHGHGAHGVAGMGHCGMGMVGGGWMRYVHILIMLLYLYVILFR